MSSNRVLRCPAATLRPGPENQGQSSNSLQMGRPGQCALPKTWPPGCRRAESSLERPPPAMGVHFGGTPRCSQQGPSPACPWGRLREVTVLPAEQPGAFDHTSPLPTPASQEAARAGVWLSVQGDSFRQSGPFTSTTSWPVKSGRSRSSSLTVRADLFMLPTLPPSCLLQAPAALTRHPGVADNGES